MPGTSAITGAVPAKNKMNVGNKYFLNTVVTI